MGRAKRTINEPTRRLDHQSLLRNRAVARWYEQRQLTSRLSAAVNLRQLGIVLYRLRLKPEELVALARDHPDRLSDLLIAYATHLKGLGMLDSYVSKTFDGLRSWLEFNKVEFRQFPKLRVRQGESLAMERTPTQDELRGILNRLSPRGRVIALAMAQSGVRPGVLGTVDGKDGLVIEDVPELRLNPARFEMAEGRQAFLIKIPPRLSKNSLGYVTFGPASELGEAVIAHLQERSVAGEPLSPRSPLVALSRFGARGLSGKSAGAFLTTKSVVMELRRAITESRTDSTRFRPYALRSFYSTQALVGRMDQDVREATLGHDMGVSGRYNLRRRLPDHVVEAMREAYERAMPSLLTSSARSPSDGRRSVVEAVLVGLGLDAEQARRALSGEMEPEEIQRLVRGGSGADPGPSRVEAQGAEVKTRLLAGWQVVAKFDDGTYVLELPSGGQPEQTVRLG